MADGTSLGTAYVQIVPSARGIKGNIEKELKGGEEAGSKFGSELVGKLKSVIAAAGIGIALKKAITEGANLEQSMGGVETLYEDAAGAVKNYAAEAAKAGISANSYAEQAVSFGASLKKAFGGDTTKSMEAANTAILDMADNAAKMGTPLESIQNAYQGFAKQNYTMLDNLKLGYGGTKSEMERLLADATKLSGVEYDISNLGDVYDAIHVIQTDLGLTGVAANEAATTISGSANAMKAAFQNVMGYLVTGDQAGLQGSIKQFVQSACAFLFDNLIPALGNIIAELPSAIATFVTTAAPMIIENGKTLAKKLIDGFRNKAPEIVANTKQVLINLVSTIKQKLPQLLEEGKEILGKIVEGIKKRLPEIGTKAGEIVGKIITTIAKNLPQILQKGAEIISKLLAGIIKMIPTVLQTFLNFVKSIGQQFKEVDWKSVGRDILQGIANGIKNGFGLIKDAAKEAAKKALDAAKNFLGIHSPSRVFRDEVGEMMGEGMALGIQDSTGSIRSAMRDLSKSSIGGIRTDLNLRPALPVVPALAAEGSGAVYNFGDITLDAHSLDDVATVQQFVDMLRRARAYA